MASTSGGEIGALLWGFACRLRRGHRGGDGRDLSLSGPEKERIMTENGPQKWRGNRGATLGIRRPKDLVSSSGIVTIWIAKMGAQKRCLGRESEKPEPHQKC